MDMTEAELKKVRGYLVEARKWLNTARYAGKTSGQHIHEADTWVNDAMLALTEVEKRNATEFKNADGQGGVAIAYPYCPK